MVTAAVGCTAAHGSGLPLRPRKCVCARQGQLAMTRQCLSRALLCVYKVENGMFEAADATLELDAHLAPQCRHAAISECCEWMLHAPQADSTRFAT